MATSRFELRVARAIHLAHAAGPEGHSDFVWAEHMPVASAIRRSSMNNLESVDPADPYFIIDIHSSLELDDS